MIYHFLFRAGGPADRAGLKTQEVVIAVNAQDTTELTHKEVVSIISNTKTQSVWLTVCERPENSFGRTQPCIPAIPPSVNNRMGLGRVPSLGSISISSPSISQDMVDSPHYVNDDSLPKYYELPKYSSAGLGGGVSGLGSRALTSSMASISISPLSKKVLMNTQQNGPTSFTPNTRHHPQQQGVGMSTPSVLSPVSKSFPIPLSTNFTSASVLVLYIGLVEIPDAWNSRELSSKCLQECTRNLLSQTQEFTEAFLEVTLHSMKILAVNQNVIYKHKREELYYAGVCSNDEQYFGIVTMKPEHKGVRKSGGAVKPIRAQRCYVFKVIQQQSVLILFSGDPKESKSGKNNKQHKQHKQKTIPISSCVTIVNAIQGLFTHSSVPGKKILDEMTGTNPSMNSSESKLYDSVQDKPQKKKLDVVDLRLSAYQSPPSSSSSLSSSLTGLISSGLSSVSQSNANMYVSLQHSGSNNSKGVALQVSHSRSMSNPANPSSGPGVPTGDYSSIGTPAYHQRNLKLDGIGNSGGSVGGGNSGTSWYTNNSPNEEAHSRSGSWDGRSPPLGGGGRSLGSSYERGGNFSGFYHNVSGNGGGGMGMGGGYSGSLTRGMDASNMRVRNSQSALEHDKLKQFSDDSSMSSLSDSRASTPTKVNSFNSRSCTPSPNRSLSFTSHSRTPSPLPPPRINAVPSTTMHKTHRVVGGVSNTTRRARMEVGSSIRAAAAMNQAYGLLSSPRTPLRRQVSL